MRRIKVFKDKLELHDDIKIIYEKKVSKFGTGAKIDCPKEYMGKTAYVIIRKGKD